MRRSWIVPLGVLASMAFPLSGRAQVVEGTLTDANTRAPVAGAAATLFDDNGSVADRATTAENGSFTLRARWRGGYWVRVERPGYHAVESRPFYLNRAESLAIRLETVPEVAEIEGVTVLASRRQNRNYASFLERRGAGWGRFLGPEELETRNAVSLAHIVAPMSPQLSLGAGGGLVTRTRAGGSCTPSFFIDGQRTDWDLFDGLPPSLVRGIEVYTDPIFVPVELQTGFSQCGAIVVWTETGLGLVDGE